MPKAHLTQSFVDSAGCEVGKNKTDYYDTLIPGMSVQRKGHLRYTLHRSRRPPEAA